MTVEYITLKIHIGDDAANQFDFDKEEITIGRHPGCDVLLKTSGVSRIHAVINHRQGKFFLKDNDSLNGTFLNEIKIVEPTLLKSGDIVTILAVTIEIALSMKESEYSVDETVFIPKNKRKPAGSTIPAKPGPNRGKSGGLGGFIQSLFKRK